MSRIGVVGDVHWSRYSSILRSRGDEFSRRLENCIESVNWAENLTKDCDMVVYLGDFFDSSELNSEEITALNRVKWNDVYHYFLVGNHEMGINDLSYSSSHLFQLIKNGYIVDSPMSISDEDCNICFFPYLLEDHRESFSDYMNVHQYKVEGKKNIVFSHNDIAGVQMGKFISQSGFDIDELSTECDIFINGHLHNGGIVKDKVINIGNLTGQNFSEDAFKYEHVACILDTDTLQCEVYENPYATNFYKLDTTTDNIDLSLLKSNAVITLKVAEDKQEYYRNICDRSDNILAYRIIIAPSQASPGVSNSKEIIAVNHLDKFSEYVLANIGNSDLIKEELQEVIS